MITTERGLFEQITEAGRKHHWRMEWEVLEPICTEFEQRLQVSDSRIENILQLARVMDGDFVTLESAWNNMAAAKMRAEKERDQCKVIAMRLDCGYKEKVAENIEMKLRIAQLEGVVAEIIEIYAGMDGFIPETAPEGYQQRIIEQMYQAANGISSRQGGQRLAEAESGDNSLLVKNLRNRIAQLEGVVAEKEQDARRYQYLTADLDGENRIERNRLLERMAVMSYSAASRDIDNAMQYLPIGQLEMGQHIPNAEFCPHCSPCRNSERLANAERLNENYDMVLRGLASFVAAGGYNSTGFIDPKIADEKIRWGIDHLIDVEKKRDSEQPALAAELVTDEEEKFKRWLSARKYYRMIRGLSVNEQQIVWDPWQAALMVNQSLQMIEPFAWCHKGTFDVISAAQKAAMPPNRAVPYSIELYTRPTPQKALAAEPVAYRYKNARGIWRYVGAPLTKGWGFPENLNNERLYLHARAAVPDGWKLVPIEPTKEMIHAGFKAATEDVKCNESHPIGLHGWGEYGIHCYRRMLAAAPSRQEG